MTLKVTHLDLVHPKKATDSLTQRNPTKTHAHPLNRSNLSEYLQLKNSSSLRAPWLPAGTGFSHINCLLCFRDMRHEAWKKPRADNCELGDWARRKANHCSIGSSLSLAWPCRHGCQLASNVLTMATTERQHPCRFPTLWDAMNPAPLGIFISTVFSSAVMRKRSRHRNPDRANSHLVANSMWVCSTEPTQRPTSRRDGAMRCYETINWQPQVMTYKILRNHH